MVAGQFEFLSVIFSSAWNYLVCCFFYKHRLTKSQINSPKLWWGEFFKEMCFSLLIMLVPASCLVISWSCIQLSSETSVLTPQCPLQVAVFSLTSDQVLQQVDANPDEWHLQKIPQVIFNVQTELRIILSVFCPTYLPRMNNPF